MLVDNNNNSVFTTVVLLQSVLVYLQQFFIYVFIYRWVYSFIYLYIYIFDDGMWQMVFKRGCGNFHLSQMSFYCDENICRISGNLYLTKVQFVRRFMVAEWCTTFLLILVWFRCPWMENDRFYMFLQRFLAFEMFS